MSLRAKQEKRTIAGKEVGVAVAARVERSSIPAEIPRGLKSLLSGMALTFSYLSHPSTVITQQYPENRKTLKMFDRYRARLAMKLDEHGYHKCTVCRLCERSCPNGSIKIYSRKGKHTKLELDYYVWRFDTCTFCNACVQACSFDAIEMQPLFETAVYDRRILAMVLNPYAGPPANVLLKIEDEQERQAAMEPRHPYQAHVPLAGEELPGLPTSVVRPKGAEPVQDTEDSEESREG